MFRIVTAPPEGLRPGYAKTELSYDFLERYFVRPQLRVHLMGPVYIGVQPAVALGLRF